MRIEVKMPNLGYDMDAGSVVEWKKEIGDHVERGEPIAEIETGKVNVEMESLASGTFAEIVVEPGNEVPVGTVIAYLETEGT
jgi:pyruvate/2-oxoglutarate dehydrogenase complex dihydrolipoamide acyltransferase (E2) component